MRKTVKDDPSYEARNAALVLDDPMGSVNIPGDGWEETLGTTLQDICKYIEGCLEFSNNPLTHLRRYFPDFDWAFHRPETEKEVAKIIKNVDYALPESTGFSDWSMGIFTATHKKCRARKKICFCTVTTGNVPELDYWPYKEIEKVGARIIINDPCATIDPKYELLIMSPLEALKYKERQHKQILGPSLSNAIHSDTERKIEMGG
jgi:hypothetical protein